MNAISAEGRHPATRQIARWFGYDHLPEGKPREVSRKCALLAADLLGDLPDGPELTAGLRKLLEAKDCAVRAAIEAETELADAARERIKRGFRPTSEPLAEIRDPRTEREIMNSPVYPARPEDFA